MSLSQLSCALCGRVFICSLGYEVHLDGLEHREKLITGSTTDSQKCDLRNVPPDDIVNDITQNVTAESTEDISQNSDNTEQIEISVQNCLRYLRQQSEQSVNNCKDVAITNKLPHTGRVIIEYEDVSIFDAEDVLENGTKDSTHVKKNLNSNRSKRNALKIHSDQHHKSKRRSKKYLPNKKGHRRKRLIEDEVEEGEIIDSEEERRRKRKIGSSLYSYRAFGHRKRSYSIGYRSHRSKRKHENEQRRRKHKHSSTDSKHSHSSEKRKKANKLEETPTKRRKVPEEFSRNKPKKRLAKKKQTHESATRTQRSVASDYQDISDLLKSIIHKRQACKSRQNALAVNDIPSTNKLYDEDNRVVIYESQKVGDSHRNLEGGPLFYTSNIKRRSESNVLINCVNEFLVNLNNASGTNPHSSSYVSNPATYESNRYLSNNSSAIVPMQTVSNFNYLNELPVYGNQQIPRTNVNYSQNLGVISQNISITNNFINPYQSMGPPLANPYIPVIPQASFLGSASAASSNFVRTSLDRNFSLSANTVTGQLIPLTTDLGKNNCEVYQTVPTQKSSQSNALLVTSTSTGFSETIRGSFNERNLITVVPGLSENVEENRIEEEVDQSSSNIDDESLLDEMIAATDEAIARLQADPKLKLLDKYSHLPLHELQKILTKDDERLNLILNKPSSSSCSAGCVNDESIDMVDKDCVSHSASNIQPMKTLDVSTTLYPEEQTSNFSDTTKADASENSSRSVSNVSILLPQSIGKNIPVLNSTASLSTVAVDNVTVSDNCKSKLVDHSKSACLDSKSIDIKQHQLHDTSGICNNAAISHATPPSSADLLVKEDKEPFNASSIQTIISKVRTERRASIEAIDYYEEDNNVSNSVSNASISSNLIVLDECGDSDVDGNKWDEESLHVPDSTEPENICKEKLTNAECEEKLKQESVGSPNSVEIIEHEEKLKIIDISDGEDDMAIDIDYDTSDIDNDINGKDGVNDNTVIGDGRTNRSMDVFCRNLNMKDTRRVVIKDHVNSKFRKTKNLCDSTTKIPDKDYRKCAESYSDNKISSSVNSGSSSKENSPVNKNQTKLIAKKKINNIPGTNIDKGLLFDDVISCSGDSFSCSDYSFPCSPECTLAFPADSQEEEIEGNDIELERPTDKVEAAHSENIALKSEKDYQQNSSHCQDVNSNIFDQKSINSQEDNSKLKEKVANNENLPEATALLKNKKTTMGFSGLLQNRRSSAEDSDLSKNKNPTDEVNNKSLIPEVEHESTTSKVKNKNAADLPGKNKNAADLPGKNKNAADLPGKNKNVADLPGKNKNEADNVNISKYSVEEFSDSLKNKNSAAEFVGLLKNKFSAVKFSGLLKNRKSTDESPATPESKNSEESSDVIKNGKSTRVFSGLLQNRNSTEKSNLSKNTAALVSDSRSNEIVKDRKSHHKAHKAILSASCNDSLQQHTTTAPVPNSKTSEILNKSTVNTGASNGNAQHNTKLEGSSSQIKSRKSTDVFSGLLQNRSSAKQVSLFKNATALVEESRLNWIESKTFDINDKISVCIKAKTENIQHSKIHAGSTLDKHFNAEVSSVTKANTVLSKSNILNESINNEIQQSKPLLTAHVLDKRNSAEKNVPEAKAITPVNVQAESNVPLSKAKTSAIEQCNQGATIAIAKPPVTEQCSKNVPIIKVQIPVTVQSNRDVLANKTKASVIEKCSKGVSPATPRTPVIEQCGKDVPTVKVKTHVTTQPRKCLSTTKALIVVKSNEDGQIAHTQAYVSKITNKVYPISQAKQPLLEQCVEPRIGVSSTTAKPSIGLIIRSNEGPSMTKSQMPVSKNSNEVDPTVEAKASVVEQSGKASNDCATEEKRSSKVVENLRGKRPAFSGLSQNRAAAVPTKKALIDSTSSECLQNQNDDISINQNMQNLDCKKLPESIKCSTDGPITKREQPIAVCIRRSVSQARNRKSVSQARNQRSFSRARNCLSKNNKPLQHKSRQRCRGKSKSLNSPLNKKDLKATVGLNDVNVLKVDNSAHELKPSINEPEGKGITSLEVDLEKSKNPRVRGQKVDLLSKPGDARDIVKQHRFAYSWKTLDYRSNDKSNVPLQDLSPGNELSSNSSARGRNASSNVSSRSRSPPKNWNRSCSCRGQYVCGNCSRMNAGCSDSRRVLVNDNRDGYFDEYNHPYNRSVNSGINQHGFNHWPQLLAQAARGQGETFVPHPSRNPLEHLFDARRRITERRQFHDQLPPYQRY